MKKRWIINILLLVLVLGLGAFLLTREDGAQSKTKQYEISQLKMADINAVKVDFPTQSGMAFEKSAHGWMMKAPYAQRADESAVQRIISIIAASSAVELPADDLSKFGLAQPEVKLTLNGAKGEQVFTFGTHNPVTEEQYVGYNNHVYLLNSQYSEAASTQAIEVVDKSPLSKEETKQFASFEFGHLEQWEANNLKVSLDAQGKWQVNDAKAKPAQNEMNEWLEYTWKQARATSVEQYTPDSKVPYPSFEVVLKDGKKIHFEKMQESPEYLLARPSEGLIYHFPNDVGFTMVNPPINIK